MAAVDVAGAEEALVVEAAAGEAGAALAVVAAGVVDVVAAGVEVEVDVDVEELRATTTNAIKMIAATTATTTRLDDFVAGLEFLAGAAATAFADFPALETAALETAALVDDPRVGTGGITIVEEADFLATFFALFLTALFLAVVFLAVVFLTAVFLAVVFFAADFFAVFFTAVFLAVVFFTATE